MLIGGTGWLILLAAAQVTVPFSGCEAIGQVERTNAPEGNPVVVPISREAAKLLAYYKSTVGSGVLAPRGWYCHESSGSGGDELVVRPVKSRNLENITGPAVIRNFRYGIASGRFAVARRIAQVFPVYRSFITEVRSNFPENRFPAGPIATDTLTYRNKRAVIFQTPPGAEGLGTEFWLKKSDQPIDGESVLIPEEGAPNLMEVAIRLPESLRWLAPSILRQFEVDAANGNTYK